MNQNKQKFREDIERAENAILMYSWLGIISAFLVVGYGLWSLT
tara:strand:- start:217 stop:345 length:129 start_codon:yes stop_codon:yes gene_type:complete